MLREYTEPAIFATRYQVADMRREEKFPGGGREPPPGPQLGATPLLMA